MGIKTTGIYHFRRLVPGHGGYGDHWRYSGSTTRVMCDHSDCKAEAKATGTERNGPVIECFYGLDGWWLAEETLCPEHAPAKVAAFECERCGMDGAYRTLCAYCGGVIVKVMVWPTGPLQRNDEHRPTTDEE